MRLWLAQGLGIGRIPFAPGTFGALAGLLWFGLLLGAGNLWLFLGGTLAGVALSVWLSDVAERTLRQKDPGSVVVDEITAMPVCFFSWVGIVLWHSGTMPALESFFSGKNWPLVLGIFALFRFFDIAKPWPVRQSQSLPGGWGITIDDVLAGIYVSLVVLLLYGAKTFLPS